MNYPGNKQGRHPLIVFEGLDCTGKTSIATRVAEMLSDDKDNKNDESDKREVMYNKTRQRISKKFPVGLAYLTDELINDYLVMRPNLNHRSVIQDRSFFSTLTYNAAITGSKVLRASKYLFTKPNLVVYLTASDEVRADRSVERGRQGFTRIFDDLELAHRVEEEYKEMLSDYNHIIVDTSKLRLDESIEIVQEKVEDYLSNYQSNRLKFFTLNFNSFSVDTHTNFYKLQEDLI